MIQLDAIRQLQPCAQRLVMAYVDAFPGSGLASGRRSIDAQAQADAERVVQRRNFIADVYAPSVVRSAMVEVCNQNPQADVATLAALFAATLGGFPDVLLALFSLHLSGYAVDLSPVHVAGTSPLVLVPDFAERRAWCEQWVEDFVSRGLGDPLKCRVLTDEDGEDVLHVQLLPRPTGIG